MKPVCAMASVIYNHENPKQCIRELKAAGMDEVLFDFGKFAHVAEIRTGGRNGRQEWDQEEGRAACKKFIEGLHAQGCQASVARFPFFDVQAETGDGAALNEPAFKINMDCMKTCGETGCETVIVQPLLFGAASGSSWEINREFYLALAAGRPDTVKKILLINQCRSQNGHLVRGVCSDAVTAAKWVDELNREAGTELFGFCLDAGVLNLCGQDMQNMASVLGKRIHAVILSENDGYGMARLLPFSSAKEGQSAMDWLGLIRGLRDAAFDGHLILDAADTELSFSPLLRFHLFPVYKALLDYFIMQINVERELTKYRKLVLFGAGRMCRNYMKCYGSKYPPLFTCDNNKRLWGTRVEGLKVKPPEALKKLPEDCGVIICNLYYQEIAAQLKEMGVKNVGYFNDEYLPFY